MRTGLRCRPSEHWRVFLHPALRAKRGWRIVLSPLLRRNRREPHRKEELRRLTCAHLVLLANTASTWCCLARAVYVRRQVHEKRTLRLPYDDALAMPLPRPAGFLTQKLELAHASSFGSGLVVLPEPWGLETFGSWGLGASGPVVLVPPQARRSAAILYREHRPSRARET